ncbi:hypothetical protein CBS101457_002393 [Exobasidium rhododendri]|nr:hypothetical protein CBS101457_002393 [Exobasidium rhododendri]
MSHAEQTGSTVNSSSNQAGSGLAASAIHKKKRYHSSAGAAIAARRAGQLGQGLSNEDDDLQAAPFISSSRDASEEDNDDAASGYSDSASSMRLPSSTSLHQQQASTGLPTSARDRALVDSKEAHRKPSVPITADKTPLSTSPPHTLARGGQDQSGHANRSPSHPGTRDAYTSATLVKASQALSTPSSNDIEASHPGGRNAGTKIRDESISSAGSSAGDGPGDQYSSSFKSGSSKIDLASLPAPTNVHGFVSNQTSVSTPKAPDALQRDHVLAQPRRKTSNSMQPVAIVAAGSKKRLEKGPEGEEATDGAATSPYDGDVEYAARTSTSQQANVSLATPQNINHSVAVHVSTSTGTAPVDVPCKPYNPIMDIIGGTMPGGAQNFVDEDKEEDPVAMATCSSIRNFIHKAIYEPDPNRHYRINEPVDGGKNPARPIRIYADGVYDLFHYAHALQLRQAKLFFPSVHLIVGVVSSASCTKHKNSPVLTSSERYTSVRNCKWVDEVVEDAPWIITQETLDKYQIDYVAHDEEPYVGSDGSADIYGFCKDQGRFLPTQRTKGVSTSELLARIVEQYRRHDYDKKLAKIGHEELAYQ